MILAGSLEFEKGHNKDIQERPSDNVELPEVRLTSLSYTLYPLGNEFHSQCYCSEKGHQRKFFAN